tara:strand:- start:8833 stop:9471 length:639 start_codon:yes stop_codon:yes gene_type:complete
MPTELKRKPTSVPSDMDRVVQTIYDDINDIIKSVNQFDVSGETHLGEVGDTRVIQEEQIDGTTKYFIEFKSRDGWARTEGSLLTDITNVKTPNPSLVNEISNGTYSSENWGNYKLIECDTTSGDVLIYGINQGVKGQILYISKKASANNVKLYNDAQTGSTTALVNNRLLLPDCTATDGTDYITIDTGYGGATFIYNGLNWICISHTGVVTA